MTTYIALIRKEKRSAFGVEFPDFPGCISSGKTLDEALRSAGDALALHMRGMMDDGEEIPAPRPLGPGARCYGASPAKNRDWYTPARGALPMGTTSGAIIELLYELAKAGRWDTLHPVFEQELAIARRCSRYRRPSSGWTFLHQAARAGNEVASRLLVRVGASLLVQSKSKETPASVATRSGHVELGQLLQRAAETGADLWEPSPKPGLLPSSCAWHEQVERRAQATLRVAYGGGVVVIPLGARYFVDSFERAVIGWHGTYDPPGGM